MNVKYCLIILLIASNFNLLAQSEEKNSDEYQSLPELNPGLESLYCANEFDNISKIWPVGQFALGVRYRFDRHYDLVLLDSKKLIVDSLRLVQVFRPNEQLSNLNFISIQEGYVLNDAEILIVHNRGTSLLSLNDQKITVVQKALLEANDPSYNFSFSLGKYSIFWNTADNPLEFQEILVTSKRTKFLISKEKREKVGGSIRLRSYLDQSDFLEIPSADFALRHNFSVAKDDLLFSFPLQNRFTVFKGATQENYYLPVKDENVEAWFVFYDPVKNSFFPVMKYGDYYIIHRFDPQVGGIYPLAKTKHKPLYIHDFRVYIRREVKERKIRYFEHHLIPLYQVNN